MPQFSVENGDVDLQKVYGKVFCHKCHIVGRPHVSKNLIPRETDRTNIKLSASSLSRSGICNTTYTALMHAKVSSKHDEAAVDPVILALEGSFYEVAASFVLWGKWEDLYMTSL